MKYWLARIATALFVPLLLLTATEFALRWTGIGYPTDVTQPCTDRGEKAYCNNLFFTAPFFPGRTLRTPRPFAIPAVKAKNTFRIVVIGESAAYGDPDAAYGFSRFLEVMLRGRFPAVNFEVVNTGITAINSHVELPVVRDLAKYQPDLFIFYTGNNEVVGPYGAGTVLTPAGMGLRTIRTSIFVRQTRIGQILTRATTSDQQRKQEWRGMEMFLDKQVPADSPLMASVYENFSANLRDMVAMARKSGAKVVVSTVATNLKDCAPFGSMHRAGLSQEALARWSELLNQGAQAEAQAQYPEALRSYLAAASIDPEYAELQFRIARSLSATSDVAGAEEHYRRARDLDTLRFRTDTRENEIIREVAKSGGLGTELLDADTLFAEASLGGITGGDLLYEHVHLTPKGNYLIARELFERIAKMLPQEIRAGASLEPPSQADSEQLLALTPFDQARVANDMLGRLQNPPFTNQLNHQEQLVRFELQAQSMPSDPADTNSRYRWALAQSPDDRMLHLKYALFLTPYDRAAAAEEMRKARPYDGFPLMLPDGTRVE